VTGTAGTVVAQGDAATVPSPEQERPVVDLLAKLHTPNAPGPGPAQR
jgi:hypothetical protein